MHHVNTEIVDDLEVKGNFIANAVVTEDTGNATKKLITHFSS